MPLRIPPTFRFRPWVVAVPLIIPAALLLACAGGMGDSDPAYAGMDLSGKTLLVLAIDTSVITLDPPDDIVDGLPTNGRVIGPRALLAERFRHRITEALRYHLSRTGIRFEQVTFLFDTAASPDSAAPALHAMAPAADTSTAPDSSRSDTGSIARAPSSPPAAAPDTAALPRPDFTLEFKSLDSRRTVATELMPKVGTITKHPLHLSGAYVLRDIGRKAVVATGRFRTQVTTARGIHPDIWVKAFDDAGRQVAKAMPFGKRKP